jgi:hypothetical protein
VKLPFVILPRAVYDDLRRDAADERLRTKRLLKLIVRMKVSGSMLTRTPTALRVERKEPSAIDRAIQSSRWASRPGVLAKLYEYVDKARRNGVTEEAIEETLRTWDQRGAASDDDDNDTIALVG